MIETYLQLLFSPEHKVVSPESVDRLALRAAAERLAFELLEIGELGASEKSVLDSLASISANVHPHDLLDQLRRRGVLRRQTAIRYVFPFPIVQEYLAASYLLDCRLDELPERIEHARNRPWAQVVQFALERHPNPSELVRHIIAQVDDAFGTSLRLIARCVVNGMRIEAALRDEVGKRLADRWRSRNWSLRGRIGQLIADGWAKPLMPEIERCLHDKWLLTSGGGEIATAQHDGSLTEKIVKSHLKQGLEPSYYPHELREAIDEISDKIFSLCADAAHWEDLSDEEISTVAGLISFLNASKLTPDFTLTLALDESVHERIRLAAFARTGKLLDPRAVPLLNRAIRSNNWRDRFGIDDALARMPDPEKAIADVLNDQSLPKDRRLDLLDNLKRLLPIDSVREAFIQKEISQSSIIPEFRDYLLVYAASRNDGQAMDELVERISTVEFLVAQETVSLLGLYRTGTTARRAADGIAARELTAGEAAGFASSIVTGMTYIYELEGLRFGGLKTAPPHPAITEFAAMVDWWSKRNDLDIWNRLNVLLASARLGSTDAVNALHTALADVIRQKINLEKDTADWPISGALSELRERQRLLALDDLKALLTIAKSNVLLRTVEMIAAHGTREALDVLVRFQDINNNGHLQEYIEKTSVRLDIVMHERDGKLAISQTKPAQASV